MAITRRGALASILSSIAIKATAGQSWPERAVTLVHGFAPGGPVDTAARLLADALSKRLGQRFIVEPRPGAAGILAAAQVARAAPDGYTLLNLPGSYAASVAMQRELAFRPIDDFCIVSSTVEYPLVLCTYSGHPIRTLADLIELGRSRVLQYGTAGVGSIQHLGTELLARLAQIKLQHIPYRGGAPALTDLLGQRLDFVPDPPTTMLEFISEGRLRPIAVTGARRFFALPEVPTVAESGFAGYALEAFQAIAAPANTSSDIIERLSVEIAAALAEPELQDRLKKLGNLPHASTPQEVQRRLVEQIEQCRKIVVEAGIDRI